DWRSLAASVDVRVIDRFVVRQLDLVSVSGSPTNPHRDVACTQVIAARPNPIESIFATVVRGVRIYDLEFPLPFFVKTFLEQPDSHSFDGLFRWIKNAPAQCAGWSQRNHNILPVFAVGQIDGAPPTIEGSRSICSPDKPV